MAQNFPLVIAGGNSLVAPYLMERLRAAGLTAEVISRHAVTVPDGFKFSQMDFTQARNWIAPENATVISLLPLPVLAQFLPRFIGISAMIAAGSASHLLKAKSGDAEESGNARNTFTAENVLRDWWRRGNIKSTLLRGALIYDGKRDYNVVRMARFIRRYHMLPLAVPGKGLRQPLHADDMAKAIVACLNNEAAYGKELNLAGSEILTYKEMAERVFHAIGMKPRFWNLQTGFVKKTVEWLSQTNLLRDAFFTTAVFQRMNEDLILDVEEGLRLLNYQPRGFRPEISL